MIKLEDFKIKDNIFGIKSDFLTAIDILYFVDYTNVKILSNKIAECTFEHSDHKIYIQFLNEQFEGIEKLDIVDIEESKNNISMMDKLWFKNIGVIEC